MCRKMPSIAWLSCFRTGLIPSCDLKWSALFRSVESTGEIFSISKCVIAHSLARRPGSLLPTDPEG